MPAILRRRKLISIKPERKNAVTYRKEEVQAEVMTPPPTADQQKIPGSTVVCPACKREVNKAEVEKNKYVCYECGSYFRVRTKNRIRMVADAGTFEPWFEYLESENPLDFPEYTQKVEAAREKTGLHEAVTIGRCKIYGEETVLGICDARFLMSSMGHVVGEKLRSVWNGDRFKASGYFVLLLRWGENAGRYYFPDADGKDFSSFKKTF